MMMTVSGRERGRSGGMCWYADDSEWGGGGGGKGQEWRDVLVC